MVTTALFALGLLLLLPLETSAFRPNRILLKKATTELSSSGLTDVSSILLTVGDYAAEIEKSTVGEEVYLPIFRAGLFLFLSGVISAFIAATIVTKSGSWDSLKDEFDEGKRVQYIYSELENREQGKQIDPQPIDSNSVDDGNVKGIDL